MRQHIKNTIRLSLKHNMNELLCPVNRKALKREQVNIERLQKVLQYINPEPVFLIVVDWDLVQEAWSESAPEYFKDEGTWKGFNVGLALTINLLKNYSASEIIFKQQTPKITFDVYIDKGNKFDIKYVNQDNTCKLILPKCWLPPEELRSEIKLAHNSYPSWDKLEKLSEDNKGKIYISSGGVTRFIQDSQRLNESLVLDDYIKWFDKIKKDIKDRLPPNFSNIIKFSIEEFILNQLIAFHSIPNVTRIIYIPSRGFMLDNLELSSLGFIIGVDENTEVDIHVLQLLATLDGRETSLTDWPIKMTEKIKKYALRSATATIMGRVLAHDWSHLLVHAKLPDEYREEWFQHFKSYLKERMVFVADVTTSQPSWTLSLPVLSQVIRPFTHVNTVLDPKPPRTAVSQHIAQSEGVTEINVKVYHKNKLIELKYDCDKGMWLACPYDVYVSIPSSIVGNHALYCLLENFARNSAKYSPKPECAEVLNIFLRLDEKGFKGSDELYRVRIWDDRSRYDEKSLRRICEFFPPSSLDHLPKFQSRNQNWRIIDDNGQVIPGGWGIKEMRISAAWLRGYPPDEALLSEESIQPPLLRPILVTKNGCITNVSSTGEAYMGYEFYLLKPKEVLIIDRNIDLKQYDIQGLRRVGIDLETDLERVKKSRHYFCFVRLPEREEDAKHWLELIDRQRQDLPAALLVVSERSFEFPLGTCKVGKDVYERMLNALKENDVPPKEILKAYKCWLQEVMNAPEQLTLVLHINPAYNQDTPDAVLEQWGETAKEFNELFSPWQMYVVKRGICGSDKAQPIFANEASLSGCPKNLVVYDYHSVFTRGSSWKAIFVEPFGGIHPTHSVLYNPPTSKWARLKTALGLVEAAIAKTVIVDERIWRRLKQPKKQEGELASKVKTTRIEVPDNFNYEQTTEDNVECLLDLLKRDQIQILIIHQGILDKAFQHKAEVKREIEKWVERVKKKAKVPFIVVISDRGIPENVPDNARFADYALVDKFVSESGFSKFYLIQSTLAATRALRR